MTFTKALLKLNKDGGMIYIPNNGKYKLQTYIAFNERGVLYCYTFYDYVGERHWDESYPLLIGKHIILSKGWKHCDKFKDDYGEMPC